MSETYWIDRTMEMSERLGRLGVLADEAYTESTGLFEVYKMVAEKHGAGSVEAEIAYDTWCRASTYWSGLSAAVRVMHGWDQPQSLCSKCGEALVDAGTLVGGGMHSCYDGDK